MTNKGRILLVDDEETFVAATSRLFENYGFNCDVAHDSAQAMAHLRAGAPDVVVADLMMPGNEDLEFVRAISEERAPLRPPVILVTGFPSLRSALRSKRVPPRTANSSRRSST